MTTQAVSITAGNPSMSKIFTDTSTDDVWSGNVLTDTIASQSIGILIPGATLTFAQAEYEAGCMAWRLQNAQSLRVTSRGWGVLAGYNCMASSQIPGVRVSPNDILTVYPLPIDTASTKSNGLAWVTTSKGTELFKTLAIVDNTFTAMKTAVNNQTLGDAFFNSQLTALSIQLEDGCTLIEAQIIDEMGGVVYSAQGNARGPDAGTRSNYYNLDLKGLAIPIGKGWSFKVKTLTA